MTLTCTNVTLRQKALRNDRISLYLDYYPAIRNPYTMKMSRREFLGIYLYAKPRNEQQRMFNQEMLNKAEAIRCIRVQSLINEEFGFLDKNKQKVDFLAYFREKARERYEKWDCVCNHFEKFCGGKCTFGDITVELCEKFRDYLLKCKQIHHPNSYISRNSAAGYYSTFRALLKIAYKEKMLRENLNDFLEKIEWKEVKKEYLTLDEVKLLAATPCRIPVLKQASLFSCMTGLRISDILKLQWSDFEMGPDQGYYIRICTEKTETEATLPISHEALELCGEWGKGLVLEAIQDCSLIIADLSSANINVYHEIGYAMGVAESHNMFPNMILLYKEDTDFNKERKTDTDKFIGFNLRNLSQLRFKNYEQLVDGLVERLEKHYGV